jgi:hypothetical protein
MRRAALIAPLVATAMLVPAAPAAACSGGLDATGVRGAIERADGAFVGRLVKRRGNLFIYRVEVRIKGRLGRRVRVHTLRGCRPSTSRDRRTGLLLNRRRGHWQTTAADEYDAGELLRAAGVGP